MSSTNPYESPGSAPAVVGEGLNVPIGFGGKLGMEELAKWLPQERWLKTLFDSYRGNWFANLAAAGLVAFGVQLWRMGDPVWPICYLAFGLLTVPIYTLVRTALWRRRNDTQRVLEECLTLAKPCRGYFDEHGGCWQDESHIVKFPWHEAHVENEASAVVISFWGSEAKFYLPSRFFFCEEDYQRLRSFLHRKYAADGKPPVWSELSGQSFSGSGCMSFTEVEQAQQWDETNWPFAKSNAEPLELAYQPKWSDWPLKARLSYLAAQIHAIVMGSLPMHMAYWIWIGCSFAQQGDWNFAWTGAALFSSAIYFGHFGWLGLHQVIQHFKHRRVQNQFIKILFDASGSLLRQGDHFVWIPFDDQMRMISNKECLGWEIPDQEGMKMEFPRRRMTPEFAGKLEALLRSSLNSGA